MKTIKRFFGLQMLSMAALSMLFSGCNKEEESVDFSDDAFLSALVELGVDTDENGKISPEEAQAVSYLDLTGFTLENMEGIEAFSNLDTLICYETGISTLDVSENKELIFLYCSFNSIASLDVSNNTRLTFLYCAGNELTSLDLSKNTLLRRLDVNRNYLTELDVTSNPALSELQCADNSIASLDVTNNYQLIDLDASKNRLTSLDVYANTALTKLWLSENQLSSLDVSLNTSLVELDIRKMSTLGKVCVWTMPFPPADVSVFTAESPNVFFTDECGK